MPADTLVVPPDQQSAKEIPSHDEKVATPVVVKKHINPKLAIIVVSILVVCGVIAASYVIYSQVVLKKDQTNTASGKDQNASLIKEVGELIILPQSETPTIATVSDKSKLADQAFFANAENGDKVLIYQKAMKAYLYRPELHKVIEVGPINIASPTPAVAGAATNSVSTPSGVSSESAQLDSN